MKLGILGSLAAAAAFAGSMANAAILNFDIDLFITDSPDLPGLVDLVNPAGTATISYDDTDPLLGLFGLAVGDAVTFGGGFSGNLDFTMSIFSEAFTDADDPDSSANVNVPSLGAPGDFTPSNFFFAITSVTDPSITSFATIDGNLLATTGPGDYRVNLSVAGIAPPPSVIPLPAPFLLLGAGLAGLGLRSKMRKKAA